MPILDAPEAGVTPRNTRRMNSGLCKGKAHLIIGSAMNHVPFVFDDHAFPSGSTIHLIAGDAGDLASIQERINALGESDAAQVFIESASVLQQRPISVPGSVAVHWLGRDRYRSPGRFGAVAARGEVLVRAVDAWLDEWIRPSSTPAERLEVWFGARTSPVVARYHARLEQELLRRAGRQILGGIGA